MSFRGEAPLQLQEGDPEPGWSGLYDPWNGRRREETPFDLFPASELYYNTEDSDYEYDVPTPVQHQEEEEEEDSDEDEVSLRPLAALAITPSPSRSPSPVRRVLITNQEEDDLLRRSSPARSPTPTTNHPSRTRIEINLRDWVFGERYVAGFVRVPIQSRGIRRRREEEDYDEEDPFTSWQRMNPVEETEEEYYWRPIRIPAREIPIFISEL